MSRWKAGLCTTLLLIVIIIVLTALILRDMMYTVMGGIVWMLS